MVYLSTLAKVALASKFLELVLACVCIALYEESYKAPYNSLLPIAFGSFIIILPVVIMGSLAGQRLGRLLDLLWSAAGLGLFVAAGALALHYHINTSPYPTPSDTGVAMGVVAIINACLFLFDLIITCRDVNEYDAH